MINQKGGYRTRELYYRLVNNVPHVYNERLGKIYKLQITKNGKLKYAYTNKKYVDKFDPRFATKEFMDHYNKKIKELKEDGKSSGKTSTKRATVKRCPRGYNRDKKSGNCVKKTNKNHSPRGSKQRNNAVFLNDDQRSFRSKFLTHLRSYGDKIDSMKKRKISMDFKKKYKFDSIAPYLDLMRQTYASFMERRKNRKSKEKMRSPNNVPKPITKQASPNMSPSSRMLRNSLEKHFLSKKRPKKTVKFRNTNSVLNENGISSRVPAEYRDIPKSRPQRTPSRKTIKNAINKRQENLMKLPILHQRVKKSKH